MLHHFVDVVAILDGFPRTISDRRPLCIEGTLSNRGLGEYDAGVILIPVGAAFDSAGITLHQHTMTIHRLDIKHDVGLLGQSERPPGHVTDHHPAVASSAPGGGEGDRKSTRLNSSHIPLSRMP